MSRAWIRWGSFFMGTGVLAGAFGAHALKNTLSDPMKKAVCRKPRCATSLCMA